MNQEMQLNFPYYIETLPLPQSNALFPLYEAISNSIDAIDERGESFVDGRIDIIVERSNQLSEELDEDAPIQNIRIEDNGIGFVDKNFKAFSEFASNSKKNRGGKGLGRLSWLKAFEYASIESTYLNTDNSVQLSFDFKNSNYPIQNIKRVPLTAIADNITKVSLINCREFYEKKIPKKLETIAKHIITHFLPKFMLSTMPQINIKQKTIDGEVDHSIDISLMFSEEFIRDDQRDSFSIFEYNFDVVHLKTKYKSKGNNKHKVYFIGNGRVVLEKNITSQDISNIPPKLINIEDEENDYIYNGYVESDFFNINVNQSRDSFDIGKVSDNELFEIPTWDVIDKDVFRLIEKYLSSYIDETRIEKYRRIEEFINEKAPEYKYILNMHKDELELISLSDIENNRINDELHRIHTKLKNNLRHKADELLSIPEGEISPDDYQKKMNELIDNLNPNGRAELVNYVIYRKIVIELLRKGLSITETDKFKKEEIIHGYFFPLKKTSDKVSIENHNLWLIDERLAYNSYLASDKPLSSIAGLENIQEGKHKRPDIFSAAFATGENEKYKSMYSSLDIIEFKRPMRDNYTIAENPIQQVIEYLRIIRNNEAKTDPKRQLQVMKNGVIYCHIICDITDNLKLFLDDKEFKQVGDLNWYIRFHSTYNAFIEVKSFDFVLENAFYRNKVLFDKLGIQS